MSNLINTEITVTYKLHDFYGEKFDPSKLPEIAQLPLSQFFNIFKLEK